MNNSHENIVEQTVILEPETAAAVADMLNLLAERFNAPAYQCDPENITSFDVKRIVGLAMMGHQNHGNSGFGLC